MRNRSGNFSVERLMEFLAALRQDVEITVRPSRKHHGQFRFFYLKQQPNRCGEVLIEITNKDFPPGRFHIFGIPKTWKLVRIETFIDHFTGRAFLLVPPPQHPVGRGTLRLPQRRGGFQAHAGAPEPQEAARPGLPRRPR
jgi:hypothetical protein